MIINSLLDLDFYKVGMSYFAWKYFPNAEVEYAFTNRNKEVKLGEAISVDELDGEFKHIQNLRFSRDELKYLESLDFFEKDFLNFLGTIGYENILPDVKINRLEDGQLDSRVKGTWPLAIFWETYILSIVNELYFRKLDFPIKPQPSKIYTQIANKIKKLKQNPTIQFVDFGTRRRYSKQHQEYIVDMLKTNVSKNQMLGTSNVDLARRMNLEVFGTFAHELPMICSGLLLDYPTNRRNEGILTKNSHSQCLDMWYNLFDGRLSVALTDTFTDDFFFNNFGEDRAKSWRGFRHDSGDPFLFGRRVIQYYKDLDIDPEQKLIVFSDSLNLDLMIRLEEEFGRQIQVIFGWGTNLTNDVGVEPLQIVMKAVSVDGREIVKLSNNSDKVSGTPEIVEQYKKVFCYGD